MRWIVWLSDGAFIYFQALAMHPAGDGGDAALVALTKCDPNSWYERSTTRELLLVKSACLTRRSGLRACEWAQVLHDRGLRFYHDP